MKRSFRPAIIAPREGIPPPPSLERPRRRPSRPSAHLKIIALVAVVAVVALFLQSRWLHRHRDKFVDRKMSRLLGHWLKAEPLAVQCPVCGGSGLASAEPAAGEAVCPVCWGVGGHYVRPMDDRDYICPHCQGMGRRVNEEGRAVECEACGGRGLVRGVPIRGVGGGSVRILQIECDVCVGSGVVRDEASGRAKMCPVCFGLGYNWVRKTAEYAHICPACGGMGRLPDPATGRSRPCERCGGRGLTAAASADR